MLVLVQEGGLRQYHTEVEISPPGVKNAGIGKGWPWLQAETRWNTIKVNHVALLRVSISLQPLGHICNKILSYDILEHNPAGI